MRITFCKLCESASVDPDGSPIIHGRLVNAFGVERFPTSFPPLTLALELEIQPSEAGREIVVEAVLLDDDGRQVTRVGTRNLVGEFADRRPGLLFEAWPIRDVTLHHAGDYRWDVLVHGIVLHSEWLRVRLA